MSGADFEYNKISSSECIGVFFDIGSSSGPGAPSWVVGDAFLVSPPRSRIMQPPHVSARQKNVYSVFQYNPPAIGFAALSEEAIAQNGVNGPVPSPTIGAVTASVTNAGSASPRVRRDILGAVGLLMVIAWTAL